MMVMKSQK